MRIIGIDQLDIGNILSAFEDASIEPGRVYRNIRTSIVVELGNDLLFQFDTPHGNLTINDKYKIELDEVFAIAGIFDLSFQFSPNNILNIKPTNSSYTINDGIDIVKKIESFVDYESWFQKIFGCFQHVLLVPDTNFLLNCYYSNYLKNIIQKNKNKVVISISRLTLFEVERKFNEVSEEIKKLKKGLEKGNLEEGKLKEKNEQIEEQLRLKRLRFQAVGEIGEMMRDGASIIPYNDNLLKSFPNASGSSFADTWIRMEIEEYVSQVRASGNDIIFLTSDLLSSLMAVAQNINTIYIYNTNNIREHNKDINKLVYSACVFFGECKVVIKSNQTEKERKFILKSVWAGKSTEEWANRKVLYDPV